MEQSLRLAVQRGDINAVFTPTVDLRTHKIMGFDASPQWIDPQHGPVELGRFIALAEEEGLIHALSERLQKGRGAEVEDVAWLLFEEARLVEGESLQDPAGFTRRLAAVMQRALG